MLKTFIVIDYTLYDKFYPIGIFVIFSKIDQSIISYYISQFTHGN